MKKALSLILSVMLLLSVIPITAAYAATDEVPEGYIGIYTIEDLYCIRYDLDKNYILMADIDMTEATAPGGDWDNGYGWAPVGENDTIPFTGIFDGNGHTIKGMQINGIKTAYAGLFGYVKDGEIKDFTIADATVTTANNCDYAGTAVGYVIDSSVSDITIDVVFTLSNGNERTYAGGAIGYSKNSTINNVKVNGTIDCYVERGSIIYLYTGGISGYLVSSIISNCTNNAVVSAFGKETNNAYMTTNSPSKCGSGGITGFSDSNSVVESSYNTGDVGARARMIHFLYSCSYSGGITGSSEGMIKSCYNTGEISSISEEVYGRNSYSGGIAGNGSAESCINLGNVTGNSNGGNTPQISSIANNTISNCYYLRGTADAGRYNTTDTATTAVALSATQMKLKAVFGYLDFDNTWFIDTSTGVMHPQLITNPESEFEHEHNYEVVVTAPTCTEKGFTTHICSTCKDKYVDNYVNALGHNFGEWVVIKPATETETGTESRTCAKCNFTETKDIPKITHTHSYTSVVTAPTCTTKGYTTYTCKCGDSYVADYVNEKGHDFGEWKVTTPASCTKKGVETRYCSRCTATETRDIEKIAHSYTAVVTAPTCTTKGYTTYTCKCGDSYVSDYVNAKGHDFGEWKLTTPATCTSKGVETRYCSRCEATETRDVEKLAHSYTAVVTAPTCTTKGYTTYTCKCGDSYVADYVNAKGHDFGAWKVTTPATCTSKGVETRYCSRCEATETRDIEKLEHTYTAVVTAPTCTTRGYTTYTCTCGDSYVADYVEAKGHTDGEWVVTKPATYTETGIRTLYCKDCKIELRTEIIPIVTGKVVSVSISNVEVKYKSGATIKPDIKTEGNVEYTVKYETSNPKVATVDDNGNIITHSKGTANITCTVTDNCGNVVKDTKTVNVIFSFGQWLIWILLFGFLWY